MCPDKAKNIYWGLSPLPVGSQSMGVYKDDHRTGCLIKLKSGFFVCGNAGVITNIDQKHFSRS